MIQSIAKLLKVMNSESEPAQISLAVCLAMIAGLTPFYSLHNLLVLLLVFLLRVNFSAFLLGWVIFSGAAFLLDPLFHKLGLWVLTLPALEEVWTMLYGQVLWRIERFNNSIVMGSVLLSLLLAIPLFFALNMLIRRYRQHILERLRKLKIVKILKASKFYEIYESATAWGGKQ
ncbi:MAG: TIGR03546 family protein [Thermodesulfobacteriota bacterium]